MLLGFRSMRPDVRGKGEGSGKGEGVKARHMIREKEPPFPGR
jgi:hypothetical protein